MKVAIIGNGYSWEKYDGWGDAVIGCNMGAPIDRAYNFTTAGNFKWLADHVTQDSWSIPSKAPMYMAPHLMYQFKKNLSTEKQQILFDRVNVKLDFSIIKRFPKSFHIDTKRVALYRIHTGKAYLGEKNNGLKSITSGHWAIIYAQAVFSPTHVRCWGFDAHLDYKTKSDTMSLEYGYPEDKLTSKKSEEHLLLAKRWPVTFKFIQSVYPNCKIEIVQ
jgi:hypothetical protein